MIDALPLLLGPEGYQINRSLRFRSSASAYLNRTPASAGDRQKFTISFWMKRGTIGTLDLFTGNNANGFLGGFRSDNTLYLYDAGAASGGMQIWSQRVFRDPSAWYHIVIAVDTTQATDSNRFKVYINGIQETISTWNVGAGASRYPSLNANFDWNNTNSHEIGYALNYGYFDGYLTEFNNVSGQQLDALSFGETNAVTGTWQPKKYAGTYGTNGFYLPFSTSASQSVTANYLVVAGGGGGGIAGGGAGAGGLLTGSTSLSTGTSYAVTVGAGGIGTNNYTSTSGGNSVFSSFTAIGGAVGSQSTEAGKNGGSGSGGGAGAPGFLGGLGTAGQGNNGGSSFGSANFGVGGGGGAGAVGANGTSSTSGAGGIGVASSISGTSTYYAGGGGGGGINGTSNGAGGTGGGGTGGVSGGANATSGTPNTGGGGGGGANGGGTTGGNGGSGVVIVSYAGAARFSGGTITSSGGNTIHTFTSSGVLTSLFNDYSPNGNNWTGNNFDVSNTAAVTYDSMIDVPTQWADGGNGRGNYCTLNPLDSAAPTLVTNGNLQITANSDACGTMSFATGKWYFEVTRTDANASNLFHYGLLDAVHTAANRSTSSFTKGILYRGDGVILRAGSTLASGLAAMTQNKVLGVAFDMDAKTVQFYVDNVAQSTAQTITDTDVMPWTLTSTNSASAFNAGQRPFAYTPPTGFKALNTLNLPTPTILKGNQYFDANIYSGQNTSLSITNSGAMQPDFVWIKKRNGATDHNLTDAVRGTNKNLISNSTAAEDTAARLTSFDTGGFTLGGAFDNTNLSGSTYVGWQWNAGGSTVTNTSGSISAQVRANPTAGFSVVTYTGNATSGATVGHGLGVAPSLILLKVRNAVARWVVYQKNVTTANNQFLELNSTAAVQTSGTNMWTVASIDGTTFGLGTNADTNGSTLTFVAYCFSAVAGYSAFGRYTGNGSADGTFVFCGFRPRFVMVKRTDSVGSWWMLDSARDTFNLATKLQRANEALAEETSYASIDMISNGFKVRVSSAESNASGGTYIFAAFAENPFKNALAR